MIYEYIELSLLLLPQKSVASLHWTSMHSDAHMKKFAFDLLLCPIYWLEQRKHESCSKWLLAPPFCLWSYLSELQEVQKPLSFNPVCVGLGAQRMKLRILMNCFISYLKKFLIKDGQNSLPLFLWLAITDLYSVVHLALSPTWHRLWLLEHCKNYLLKWL